MNPSESRQAFAAFVEAQGSEIAAVSPVQLLELFLRFYRTVPALGVAAYEQDGDMLLFQYGTYGRSSGRHFEYDVTRQFLVADEEGDDALSQLHCSFEYEPSAETEALGAGHVWCRSPAKLAEVRADMLTTQAYRYLASHSPIKTVLRWERV